MSLWVKILCTEFDILRIEAEKVKEKMRINSNDNNAKKKDIDFLNCGARASQQAEKMVSGEIWWVFLWIKEH